MRDDREIVRRFGQLRVLVVGDAILDTFTEGTATRLCTEGPVPVVRKCAERRAPGGAANTAANVRALGAQVVLLAAIGRDEAGSALRQGLRDLGVDDRWCVEHQGAATLHKHRILADGHYVVRLDDGEPGLSPECERALLARFDEELPRCDAVLVSDYGYGVASDALLDRLRGRDLSKLLVVDSKQLHRFLDVGASVVKPNHVEAQQLGERLGLPPTPVERLASRLMEATAWACVALTMADRGVLLAERTGATTRIPAPAVPDASDVGAGDTFVAAMTLALAGGAQPLDAAHVAVDAATIAVGKRGTAVVGRDELLDYVVERLVLTGTDTGGTFGEDGLGVSRQRLVAELDEQRAAGKTIVFTNGVFDILHAGHAEFLRRAKRLGDVLVVAVNSDRSVRRIKGPSRPINPQRDRLALISALDCVDHALLFDEDTPVSLIRAIRPHVHVKGGDYNHETLPEAAAVREVGGRVVILPRIGALSTTRVIERIVTVVGSNGR